MSHLSTAHFTRTPKHSTFCSMALVLCANTSKQVKRAIFGQRVRIAWSRFLDQAEPWWPCTRPGFPVHQEQSLATVMELSSPLLGLFNAICSVWEIDFYNNISFQGVPNQQLSTSDVQNSTTCIIQLLPEHWVLTFVLEFDEGQK